MVTLTERTIMKSRSGVYSDTAENRRKHRVGQKYGAEKQPEDGKKTEKKEADTAKELEAVNKVIAAINEGKLNLPAEEVIKLSEKKRKLEVKVGKDKNREKGSQKKNVKAIHATKLKVGDVLYDWEAVETGKSLFEGTVKNSQKPAGKITKIKPFKNGFGEVVASEAIFEDGSKEILRGTYMVNRSDFDGEKKNTKEASEKRKLDAQQEDVIENDIKEMLEDAKSGKRSKEYWDHVIEGLKNTTENKLAKKKDKERAQKTLDALKKVFDEKQYSTMDFKEAKKKMNLSGRK